MPRGQKREIVYTGKALQISNRIKELESELKQLRADLKVAYKEQLKAEKAASVAKEKADMEKLIKAIKKSGKSPEEILAMIEESETEIAEGV